MLQVIYNQGNQTVLFAPVDHKGHVRIVSSPTCAIFDMRRGEDDDDREIVAAGTAATIGSETETLAAAAGPSQADPTLLDVTDASDFIEGRTYHVSDLGVRESFILERVDTTNNRLYSATELRNDYTTAGTVAACMCEATFPTAEAADETEVEDKGGPYVAVWTYTIDSEKYVVPTELFLDRYSVQPYITESDIMRAHPPLARLARGAFDLRSAAAQACDEFMADVKSAGESPPYFLPSTRKIATVHKALELCFTWRGDTDLADRHRDDYHRLLGNILTARPPAGSVNINPVTDTANAGTEDAYRGNLMRRS